MCLLKQLHITQIVLGRYLHSFVYSDIYFLIKTQFRTLKATHLIIDHIDHKYNFSKQLIVHIYIVTYLVLIPCTYLKINIRKHKKRSEMSFICLTKFHIIFNLNALKCQGTLAANINMKFWESFQFGVEAFPALWQLRKQFCFRKRAINLVVCRD